MGRCSFFERQGATYLEVAGGGLYKAQDRDEIIFENDDWCLVARKPRLGARGIIPARTTAVEEHREAIRRALTVEIEKGRRRGARRSRTGW